MISLSVLIQYKECDGQTRRADGQRPTASTVFTDSVAR